jgi:hypothetical protein
MPRDGYTGSRIAWASAERRPPLRRERADCMFESRRALEGRVLSNHLRDLAKTWS